MRKKRTRLEIISKILTAIENEKYRTRIIYKTNLSFAAAMPYFKKLEEYGLIRLEGNHYKKYYLTERGRLLLRYIHELKLQFPQLQL